MGVLKKMTIDEKLKKIGAGLLLSAGLLCSNPSFSQETSTATAEQKQKDKTVEQLVEEGKGFSEKEDYKTAIRSYQKAIEQKPTADAYLRMGFALHQAGEYKKSLEAVVKAMELKPDFEKAEYLVKKPETFKLLQNAWNEASKRNYNNAKKACEAAIKLEPENPEMLYCYGILFFNEKNYKMAEKYLKEAINKNPRHRKSWRMLGYLYLEQGRINEAANLYSIYSKLNPNPELQKGDEENIEKKLRENTM